MLFRSENIINSFFDHVFVINLSSRPEKWTAIQQELDNLGVKNYSRFDAIRPDLEQVPPFLYENMTLGAGAQDLNNYLRGSVGCKLSHLKIIELALEKGYEKILILEDDVGFKRGALRKLRSAIKDLPQDWEMLYLGGNLLLPTTKISRSLSKIQSIYTTHAYGLNLKIAEKILKEAPESGKEIDVFYAEHIQPHTNCFITRKPIALQQKGWSDIIGGIVNYGCGIY
jgi:GR25 family glycosyltransferase involved in LPS biosynthesis